MKIIIIAQRLPYPPNKGEKLRSYYQIEYLVNQGHSVTVVAPTESTSDLQDGQKLQQKLNVKVELVDIGNRKLKLLTGLLANQCLSVANFYGKALQVQVDSLLATAQFDCILCTASSVAEYVFKSPMVQKKRDKFMLLMDFMDLDSDKWRQYAAKSKFPMSWVYQREAKLLSKYENRIHEYFDQCFFVSNQEVTLFGKQLNSQNTSIAIGNGIDFSEFKPVLLADKPQGCNLLFTGVMDYAPNVDAVVWFVEQVWPKIIAECSNAKFIIAGMRPTAKVKELTKFQGIEVTGFVDDIMPYYNQAHVFVAPFRIARGVQNKVLQAFACGLPTVATSMGAEGINCQDGQHLLVADEADDFANAVLRLINEGALAQGLGTNAVDLMQAEYAWESKLSALNIVLNKESVA
ncbi:TIGR03087 family PEP-CTERM/XrtA system glycosyltransferase [Catenovulum agarivorans]|uniref:TIGR03087 family PEP-CTERM/XrtA system glycosyltransferase n=1 Tax=Catenovulum agarivorans TaxID=1172192 RepID=UPI00030428C4|nr:TIGR03087 family PEP-CTERM/XrtA system glycosyltransferase [Catenovulum agarivorans]